MARLIWTPRTISSSVLRAQSTASRLVRKVLILVGHPRLRMIAFHVFEGVLVMLATVPSVPGVYRECTEGRFLEQTLEKNIPKSLIKWWVVKDLNLRPSD